MPDKKTLEERFDANFKARDRLDDKYWKEVEKSNDEYEKLMAELTSD